MGVRHVALSAAVRGSRRSFVAGLAASMLDTHARAALAHNSAGAVSPPESPPPVTLTLQDDSTSTLLGALTGHVTAVQLMFTSCQATCPIQGALFAATAKALGEASAPARLLSVSIDPAHDSPAALREWLKRFGPSPRWRAARPKLEQLAALVAFLKSQNPGPDPHTAQVYFFNRKAELVLRSVDFPASSEIIRVLRQLVRTA